MLLYIMIGILTLAADIVTKQLAVHYLSGIDTLPVISGVFHLTYVENAGVAFGLFKDARIFFIIVSIIVLVLISVFFKTSKNRSAWLKLGTALVFAGAIGNLIERVMNGYVVDFLDFCLFHFPVFNVADIAVCVGVVMLAIHYLFYADKEIPKTALNDDGKAI